MRQSAQTSRMISCLMVGFVICVLATPQLFADTIPPYIEITHPADGEIWVDPSSSVEALVVDPEEEFIPGSGVDINSIRFLIMNVEVRFQYEFQGDGKVLISTLDEYELPELTWVEAEIVLKDKAGNSMPVYEWKFLTRSLPDTIPPAFSSLSPPIGATDVPLMAQISCKILDYESGVDPDSVAVSINGESVAIKIRDIPFGQYVTYSPVNPYGYEQLLVVRVDASDHDGNPSFVTWSFRTEPAPPEPPRLDSPQDNALLNYQLERGVIRFQWSYDPGDSFYRIKIVIPGCGSVDEMDFGPGDYIRVGSLAVYNYHLSENSWCDLSYLGDIIWSVAKIDGYRGNLTSGFSGQYTFNLASPYIVVLRSPQNNARFFAGDSSPVFSWDPFEGASMYLLGLIRVGTEGELMGEAITRTIESEFNSFRFRMPEWQDMRNGLYMWTVVAIMPDGTYSDFVNYRFSKRYQPLISEPIHTR